MSHNYYLYNDPATGLLTWIPWDNNEAFKGGSMRTALSMSLDEVNANWPLIRYLMDDPVYQASYVDNVAALINGGLQPGDNHGPLPGTPRVDRPLCGRLKRRN